ncbi:MAG: site-2 protease family protein [Nannocystaceae bacterium]|nr:site-2 protease family protein [Nannocystaceae bacterium]
MSKRIADSPGVELDIQLERDGKRIDRVITPRKIMRRNQLGVVTPVGRLGVLSWFYAPQIGITNPESPAAVGGLKTGDIITSINGEPVRTGEELQRMLDATGSEQVRLTYLRAEIRAGPLAKYMLYESAHALLLPRKAGETDVEDLESATGIVPANTFIRSVEAGSPAAKAGIKAGDRFLAVDGVTFAKWEYLSEVLAKKRDSAIELKVQSLGEPPRTLTVTQALKSYRDLYAQDRQYLWFGAQPYAKGHKPDPEPIRGRITYALGAAVDDTTAVIGMMWTTLRQMLTFQRGVEDLSSVIGLFNVAGTAADQGPGEFLILVALLSINLGFVNLLPIPILDGGHLLFFTIEAVRRRPLSQRAREIASAIGLVMIILLMLVASRNDILRYW